MSTETVSPKTVAECRTEMREALESFDAAKPERIGSPSIQDCVRQGDLYLVCIESLPKGKETKERQLVPGTTQGSRHVLSGDATIVNKVTFKDMPDVLVGPAFHCNGEVTIEHPEHGDKILPEDTTWQCVYQQAYAEQIRRAMD